MGSLLPRGGVKLKFNEPWNPGVLSCHRDPASRRTRKDMHVPLITLARSFVAFLRDAKSQASQERV